MKSSTTLRIASVLVLLYGAFIICTGLHLKKTNSDKAETREEQIVCLLASINFAISAGLSGAARRIEEIDKAKNVTRKV